VSWRLLESRRAWPRPWESPEAAGAGRAEALVAALIDRHLHERSVSLKVPPRETEEGEVEGTVPPTLEEPNSGAGKAPPSMAPSSLYERWFESMRPAASAAPERVSLVPPESRPRRRLGWTAVTIAMSMSLCIVAAASVVHMRRADTGRQGVVAKSAR
jgi:hypothetical protein